MTTIANRKFSEMRQLEFQSLGTSEVNTMLLQPLLDKSSTWVAEITDLQVDLSEELAFPENKRLFSIIQIPKADAEQKDDDGNVEDINVEGDTITIQFSTFSLLSNAFMLLRRRSQ